MAFQDADSIEDAMDLMIDSDIDMNSWADTWSQLEAEEAFIASAEKNAIMDLQKTKTAQNKENEESDQEKLDE